MLNEFDDFGTRGVVPDEIGRFGIAIQRLQYLKKRERHSVQ